MEDVQSEETPPASVRRKTACAECRQQKMRCEGYSNTLDPPACSRCHRLKIPCVFSAPFKRTHKRKRLQELEEETTALKRQLLSTSPAPRRNSLLSPDAPPRQEENIDISRTPNSRSIRLNEQSVDNDATMSRTIDGLELSHGVIDDCFELYFKHYHFMLPILDLDVSPNTYYQHTPFLFWVIVAIGSRSYTRQPTLTQVLALPVTQLALQSVVYCAKPIERIKALLLLLAWPFPSGPFYRDPSFMLCGILLHMAMRFGLHVPTFSQEFSKTYFKVPEQEPLRRAELWAYVVIAYQRTCAGSGQANLVSFEIYNEQPHLKPLLEKLPGTVRIQLQISNIITRAHKALLDLGLISMTPQQERTMDALLKGFHAELDSLESLTPSVWDRLYIATARQDLVAMHFYKSATTLDLQSCILIFDVTSSVIEQVRDLDRGYGIHRACTRFLLTSIIMSLGNLARIFKGPLAGYLDQVRGYDLFDTGVRFTRSCSVQKADYAERGAAFAEQMWRNKKIFRNSDGSANITMRVRTRLSAGPLHDAVRSWKSEFYDPINMPSASGMDIETNVSSNVTAGLDATLAPSALPTGALSTLSTAPECSLDDELLGDLELELSGIWDMTNTSASWMA